MISAERHTLAFNTSTAAMLASESCSELLKQLRQTYGVTETADVLAAIALAFTDAEAQFLNDLSGRSATSNNWDAAEVPFEEAMDNCVHRGLLAALPTASPLSLRTPPSWEAQVHPAVSEAFQNAVHRS